MTQRRWCITCMTTLAEPGQRRCADCLPAYQASHGKKTKPPPIEPDEWPPLTGEVSW